MIVQFTLGNNRSFTVELLQTFLCRETEFGYEPAEIFRFRENVYFCTTVEMSQANRSLQIYFILFQDEISRLDERIWDSTMYITEGSTVIPLEVEPPPGHYCLQVKEVRSILFETCFDVQ